MLLMLANDGAALGSLIRSVDCPSLNLSDLPSTMMRSARRSAGAAKPVAAAMAISSSLSASLSLMSGSKLYRASLMTPTPPTGVPDLYRGNPPGSADRPSGDRIGPTPTAPENRFDRSEHGNWLNWTPNNGPAGCRLSPGLKCSWTIWLAVLELKALPSVDR